MMPKGVEHAKTNVNNACTVSVSLPMMPKGVEHVLLPFRYVYYVQ